MVLGHTGEHLLGRFVTAFEKVAAAAERFSLQHCKHEHVLWTSRSKDTQVEGQCDSCGALMKMGLREIQWILDYKKHLAKNMPPADLLATYKEPPSRTSLDWLYEQQRPYTAEWIEFVVKYGWTPKT